MGFGTPGDLAEGVAPGLEIDLGSVGVPQRPADARLTGLNLAVAARQA